MDSETSDPKMIPIAISEFLNGMVAPADLYMKLGSGKRILLFKNGAKFDNERLDKYRGKDVTHLWVNAEEFQNICNSAIDIANAGITQAFLDASKRTFLISNAAQSVYRTFQEVGLDLKGYEHAQRTSEAILKISKSDFDIETMVGLLNEADSYLTSHSVAVSILAPTIGQEMEIENEVLLKKLALGGLFHDIGKLQVNPELLTKPVGSMDHNDLKEYQMHCLRGAEMLKGLQLNSEDLTKIVYQHHERNDGSGYPQRLKNTKIHPLAKIVGISSEFLNLIMPNPRFNSVTYKPKEALGLIGSGMGQPFDKNIYEALERVVGIKNSNTVKEAA